MVNSSQLSEIGIGIRPSLDELIGSDTGLEKLLEEILERDFDLLDIATVLGGGRVEKSLGRLIDRLNCRDRLFLIAKGGVQRNSDGQLLPDGRPEQVKQGVSQSLDRLGFDQLDCYQIYWPDDKVPVAETVGALAELRDEGLIKKLGVSNFSARQLEAAERGGKIDFVQFPYSLFQLQAEQDLLPYCRDREIRRVAYGALCRGLLTDDFLESGELEYDTLGSSLEHVSNNFDLYREAVSEVADYLSREGFDCPFASVMIAWTLLHPGIDHSVTVAHNTDQVKVVAEAREVELAAEQAEEIGAIVKRVIGDSVDIDFIVPPHVDAGE